MNEEHDTASTEAVVVRSEDLWLQDGNIVVRATSQTTPPKHTLFKVHKFVLALHCAAFESMFASGPQSALVAEETYEGLPILDFVQDDPDDVCVFLRALYLPKETQRHWLSSSDGIAPDDKGHTFPPTYTGILRLSSKYVAPDLRAIAVRTLKKDWPNNAYEWSRREDGRRLLEQLHMHSEGNYDFSQLHSDPAKAIRLATEFNVPDVLPAAYYDLFRICSLQPPVSVESVRGLRLADLSVLRPAELQKLLLGGGALRFAFIEIARYIVDDTVCNLCESGARADDGQLACRVALDAWLQDQADFRAQLCIADPVGWLDDLRVRADDIPDADVCKACRVSMSGHIVGRMHELWAGLVSFFDLPVAGGEEMTL